MEKIKVIAKRPDSNPYATWVSNRLGNLQNFVEGYIEVVTICPQAVDENGECTQPGMAVICNEEGILWNLPYNCRVDNCDYVGTILFVGVKGDEFCDIPVDFQEFKRMFPELWEVKDDQ